MKNKASTYVAHYLLALCVVFVAAPLFACQQPKCKTYTVCVGDMGRPKCHRVTRCTPGSCGHEALLETLEEDLRAKREESQVIEIPWAQP